MEQEQRVEKEPPVEQPWEKHLNECLNAAEAVSKPWASSVRAAIFDDRRDMFELREPRWKNHGAEVLKNSELAGIVARACADFERKGSEVTLDHMLAGIAAAHKVCKARVPRGEVGILLFWCE